MEKELIKTLFENDRYFRRKVTSNTPFLIFMG